MHEIVHEIRKGIITQLTNNVSYNSINVPIYNFTPQGEATPFIRIYTTESSENFYNSGSYMIQANIRIDVITSFDGDSGGELQANQIMDQVINLTRTRSENYIDLSSNNAKVISVLNNGINYSETFERDRSYVIANLDLQYQIQLL